MTITLLHIIRKYNTDGDKLEHLHTITFGDSPLDDRHDLRSIAIIYYL